MKKLVTLTVTVNNYRGEKTDRVIGREAEEKAGAEKGTAKGSVFLIPDQYYTPVKQAMNKLRGWVYANSLSFGHGVQAVPADRLDEFKKGFAEMAQAYVQTAKENIIDKRDEIEALNKAGRLGDFAQRHSLPSDLSSRYNATFRMGSAEVDPILTGLEKEVADQITADCKAHYDEVMAGCFDELTARVVEMASDLVKTMSDKDVKNKKFDGTLKKIRTAIDTVRGLDFSGDAKLNENLDKLEEVCAGLTNASLKASAEERAKVKTTAQAVIADLLGEVIAEDAEPQTGADEATVDGIGIDLPVDEIVAPEPAEEQERASTGADLDFDALGF